jgi:hypothetical protein
MTRDEKIQFMIEAIEFVEGIKVDSDYFEGWSDDKLEERVQWMDYLMDK